MDEGWKRAIKNQLRPDVMIWTIAGVIVGQVIIQGVLWLVRQG